MSDETIFKISITTSKNGNKKLEQRTTGHEQKG